VAVPVFGATGCWPATCLPRPANRRLSQWQICFPETDPARNLRLREVAFALLNPAHDSLRAAGVFQKADPRALSTVILIIRKLTVLAAWAAGKELPRDLSQWDTGNVEDFLAETSQRADPSTVRCYIVAIRTLHDLAGVLTGGGLPHDPWPGQTSSQVARSGFTDALTTPVISPHVWWPLLRAAWTYIHTFAPDLLGLRDRLDREQRRQAGTGPGSPRMRPAEVDALLGRWLAESYGRPPGRAHFGRLPLPAGAAAPDPRLARRRAPGGPAWLRPLRQNSSRSAASATRVRGREPGCGATETKIVAKRPEGGICNPCYRVDPQVVEECGECSWTRCPAVRLPGGGSLCRACWKRPSDTTHSPTFAWV
jgi:hypothetical protein